MPLPPTTSMPKPKGGADLTRQATSALGVAAQFAGIPGLGALLGLAGVSSSVPTPDTLISGSDAMSGGTVNTGGPMVTVHGIGTQKTNPFLIGGLAIVAALLVWGLKK
jgi:hypothetical protein